MEVVMPALWKVDSGDASLSCSELAGKIASRTTEILAFLSCQCPTSGLHSVLFVVCSSLDVFAGMVCISIILHPRVCGSCMLLRFQINATLLSLSRFGLELLGIRTNSSDTLPPKGYASRGQNTPSY
jgi:hypothetical protein